MTGCRIAWATTGNTCNEVNRLPRALCHAITTKNDRGVWRRACRGLTERDRSPSKVYGRGEVIFLHEVREGAADRSYGVQVCENWPGLPESVIARAHDVLEALEKGEA